MEAPDLLRRITADPAIFGGKPIIRGKRLAVEHVLSMLAAGDSASDLTAAYPFLEADDIRACMLYAYKLVLAEYRRQSVLDDVQHGQSEFKNGLAQPITVDDLICELKS